MPDTTKPKLQVVRREDYLRDPVGVLKRSAAEGPIAIRDSNGYCGMVYVPAKSRDDDDD